MAILLSGAQMQAVEAAAMERGEVTGAGLMERAGCAVVAAILARWPDPGRTVVLCGPGNNGGDGFVVARLLQEAGWRVSVFLLGDAARLPPDAARNHVAWNVLGPVGALGGDGASVDAAVEAADLVVDALFGTGLHRAVAGLGGLRESGRRARWVAVDIPSGLCADSGRTFGDALAADLTVTFHRAKLGHYLGDGPRLCGALVVAPIGLDGAADPDGCTLIDVDGTALAKQAGGNKYNCGHALVLSGGVGRGGAARMAARAALRVGAGLVTLGAPPAALIENAARLDAVMLRRVADAEGLAALLEDRRINALCLGPGLGVERAAGLMATVLEARRATVIDADGLTALAGDRALFARLHDGCVLTPHGGEFARLFPDIAARLDAPAVQGPIYSKCDATREAARGAGCVVVFKGEDTVIADPSGRCAIHSAAYGRAAPWLATAGTGDVLAGLITGLLARGLPAFEAAGTAAWLHVEAALRFGPGLIAEDLPEALPGVFRAMGV